MDASFDVIRMEGGHVLLESGEVSAVIDLVVTTLNRGVTGTWNSQTKRRRQVQRYVV